MTMPGREESDREGGMNRDGRALGIAEGDRVEFEWDEAECKTRPTNGRRSCVISCPLGPPPTTRMVRSLSVRLSELADVVVRQWGRGRGIEEGLRKKAEWKARLESIQEEIPGVDG
jgi:hypothetical protein